VTAEYKVRGAGTSNLEWPGPSADNFLYATVSHRGWPWRKPHMERTTLTGAGHTWEHLYTKWSWREWGWMSVYKRSSDSASPEQK
jgi:hypothetical protein